MLDWNAGYVSDIGYTFGYYTELNPLMAKLAFLNKGIAYPEIGTACELGFGQGISANIHAAATTTKWYGTDFNPSHAGFAQDLAQKAESNAMLYDDSFEEFAQRKDLPEFDYIGLHGIWSWISDENRSVIVDFIRRRLKVGGILYVSYNTLPGWAAFAPIRHLMTDHAEIIGSEGRGIVNRIDEAIEFADKLLSTNPLFLRANPLVADQLKALKNQDRHYLAHEYFNRDWHPMHFSTIEKWLAPAKVQYACSANYLGNIDYLNFTEAQSAFLKEIPDVMFRESVRDFMVNERFRKDLWVRGQRRISNVERMTKLRELKVILTTVKSDIELKAKGLLEAELRPDIYEPFIELLSDLKPKSIGEIEIALKDKGISISHVIEAVMMLTGSGHLQSVQELDVIEAAKKNSDNLNYHFMKMACGADEIRYLASPVTGGGIIANRFQLLFLLAIKTGLKTTAEWTKFAWDILNAQNQRIVKEGKAIEDIDENIAELKLFSEKFETNRLPILKALKIV